MINNNRQQQNGRRRGRGGGGQRPGGGGGGQGGRDTGNRIDSRARGNAAQLLEKYKSLARDAQMHGDRVNTEYYLQFADHYFRVVSEQRGRFEEQNQQPRAGGANTFDEDDFEGDENEARADEQAQPQAQRDGYRDNANGNRDGGNRDGGNRDNGRDGPRRYEQQDERSDRGGQEPRRERFQRDQSEARDAQRERQRESQRDGHQQAPRQQGDDLPAGAAYASEGEPATEQQPRPRRGRPPRATEAPAAAGDTFDIDRLPPSFAPANDAAGETAGDDTPAEKPRRRRLRPAADAG